MGTDSCFRCVKDGHKVRDCPMIASRGREGKQVAPSVLNDDALTKRHLYTLHSRGKSRMRVMIMLVSSLFLVYI